MPVSNATLTARNIAKVRRDELARKISVEVDGLGADKPAVSADYVLGALLANVLLEVGYGIIAAIEERS